MAERTYRSPLREEQARQTRALILDTLIELVSAEGAAELSIRDLADRAGVAQRTVYRHFPDRAALLDALADHVGQRSQWREPRQVSEHLGDIGEAVEAQFRGFDANAAETRALVLLNLDPARTAAISRRNHVQVGEMVARDYPDLDDDDRAVVTAVIHLLASSRTWLRFRDEAGLSPEQAGRGASWALRAVLRDLDERRTTRRDSTRDGEPTTDRS